MQWKNRLTSAKFRPMRIFGLTMFVLAVTFGGCTVGPNYERPQEKVPGTWSGPTGDMVREANEASAEELVHWWTTLGDETLTSLVERAVKSNLTVRRAEMQIRQARAARGIAAGGAWPSVDATGSFVRSQPSGGATGNLYHAGLDAAWEVDIFGGVRRSIEAAEADVQAAVEEHRDVLVTLSAEVALNYIDLRGFQQQIVIARNNLAAQKRTASLTRERFQGGFVSALDAANAEAQAATTAAGIPLLESAARQTIYVLSVLLGREPSALVEELSPTATIPGAVPRVPVAVPSELLRRRPDIRRAEAQIHAATARIGVATADLFPRISLPGAGGYQGSQFGSLTDWKNRFWSLGPSASWTVFDAGRIGWNIELQKALKEQSFIAYRQTVLTALQEVENALIASAKEQEHREALVEAAAANRKAMELSTQLYTQGQTDFLNVLQAERALYSSEDALVQSTRDVSTNLVALYKALGGGWSEGLGASAIRNKPE